MKHGRKLLAATAGLAAVSYIACGGAKSNPEREVHGNLMAPVEPVVAPSSTAEVQVDAAVPPVPTLPMVSGNLMAPMPLTTADAATKAPPASTAKKAK
jgi:hypothetical protein